MKCDMCLTGITESKFVTFQPKTGENETHYVCDKCINNLVSDYFNLTKTGSW